MRAHNSGDKLTRREFLRRGGIVSGAAMGAKAVAFGTNSFSTEDLRSNSAVVPGKTVLTFYVDDTNPYIAGVEPFREFLDFVKANGIAGESSMILGFSWEEHGLISRPKTAEQRAYIGQLRRAYDCGIDSRMELMTHDGLLDFRTGRAPVGIEHEGIWLYEPKVSLDEYQSYFSHIIAEGNRIGVRFTGVTWPGCSCGACVKRDAELGKDGVLTENPNLWKALLNLAKQGEFRGPTVPCFILGGDGEHPVKMMAGEGKFGIYDLYPHAKDHFGIWENNPARVDADYYISADGESGKIAERILARKPHCVFYAHWQGVNPASGVGWGAFKEVVGRVHKHYADRVVWKRPSALAELFHRRGTTKAA